MKIYIIDDDHLSIFLTENMLLLEYPTLEIRTYLSAHEVLSALGTEGSDSYPDIVFLDLNMPAMDGWGFLDELKQLHPEIKNRCRIFVLTSSLSLADSERSKDYAIVSGLIHKPLHQLDIKLVFQQKTIN
ncbi:CheY-like chemotaxis protein [Pontibacter aydingkolensis]|uniref:Response regulator n=1 Tax=Pontibacter aydingkolensis TaxID=1911536 RepID=A0ABS7CUN6_9BACT|nr:response regulator [Pontibacter aydingkolensis]MBW7467386.1 response regulator [Pontibacter aydingkolensis]